jgi:hypothetical protein
VKVLGGGSIDVRSDMLLSSGSAGDASIPGNSRLGAVYLVPSPPTRLSLSSPSSHVHNICWLRTGCHERRSLGSDQSHRWRQSHHQQRLWYPHALLLLNMWHSSHPSSPPGGSCETSLSTGSYTYLEDGFAGLVAENVWNGEIVIGGDLRVGPCHAGTGTGGDSVTSAVFGSLSLLSSAAAGGRR